MYNFNQGCCGVHPMGSGMNRHLHSRVKGGGKEMFNTWNVCYVSWHFRD